MPNVLTTDIFQIWKKGDAKRQKVVLPIRHADFEFLPAGDAYKADFAIQRVGADAGRLHHNLKAKASAHYFVRSAPGVDGLEEAMHSLRLDFKIVAECTSGKPSLAKTEVVQIYNYFRS